MKNEKNMGVFVEEKFLLEIMPSLDVQYVKIYMMAKYLASKNNFVTDVQTVCDALGNDRKEVCEAFRVLAKEGALKMGTNETVAFSDKGMTASINTSSKPDRDLLDMLVMAERILGKMLSPVAVEKLYSFHDWLGMSPELILRLLEYCAEIDKKDIRYIEKVAISWNEQGIDTVARAETHIRNLNYRRSYEYKIRTVLGIGDRALGATEKKYIEQWYNDKISVELVSFAYDYCVAKTGKYAAPYLNKVIIAWYEMGIKTPEDAKRAIEKYSAERAAEREKASVGGKGKKTLEVYNSGRYDYDKIDALARAKLKKRIGKE